MFLSHIKENQVWAIKFWNSSFMDDQDTSSYLSRHVTSILKVTSWSQLATSVPAIVSTFPANNRGG